MKKLSILTLGAAMLLYTSCGNNKVHTVIEEYNTDSVNTNIIQVDSVTNKKGKKEPIQKRLDSKIQTLEGKIIKVQTGHLSYLRYPESNSATSPQHEFEYVFLKDPNDKTHLLIYPYTKGILEGVAKINYTPLTGGATNSSAFVRTFINTKYASDTNIPLECEGFIVKGGIQYK